VRIIRSFIVRAALGAFLTLLAAALPVQAQDGDASGEGPDGPIRPERPYIVEIRFEGNRRYTDAFLKEQIASKEGDRYDPGLIKRDELRLRDFFSNVKDIRTVAVEGGVELVFEVDDDVVVGKVEYRGLARVPKADFKDLVATRSGRPLHVHALESDKRLIERLHRESGYHFVDVQWYRRKTNQPDVEDIVFQILPGPRPKVWKVVLEGARSVEREEILKILKNSSRHRTLFLGLGRWLRPSYFNRTEIDQDVRRIELYYHKEGWRDARVVYEGVRFHSGRERAVVKFRVEEGRRYALDRIEVEYLPDGLPIEKHREALAPEKLAALAHLSSGDPYRIEEVSKTLRDIKERLWSLAYADSQVREISIDNAKEHTVLLKILIKAGPRIKLGRLRFFGNRWTKDNVLRREFRKGALPGDFLDIDSLRSGRNRLLRLRYFSAIRFGSGRGDWGLVADPDAPEDVRDVHVTVQETETRQFQFGAGVSTDGGAFGNLSVTWRNFDIANPPDRLWDILDDDAFRGAGQRFTISLAPGATFSSFAIIFSDPAVRDSKWSLTTNFSRRLALFEDYDLTTDTALVRVGRYIDEARVWNIAMEWSLRQVILDDPDPDAPVNALDVQGSNAIHGLGVILSRTKRSDVDLFLNGHVTTLQVHFLGGPFGGDVDVVKVELEHRAGWRLFRTERGWYRLQATARANWATAHGDSPEVPIFERYFLGGRNLRGFEFREVGPRSNGRPTGGEFAATLSTEVIVPLLSREAGGFGIDFVLFVDQGVIAERFHRLTGDDWRASAGFGFAISFGGPSQPPLQVDFGFPIDAQGVDEEQVVSVAFVRNF